MTRARLLTALVAAGGCAQVPVGTDGLKVMSRYDGRPLHAQAQGTQERTVTVNKGDTLWGIAQRNGTTVAMLQRLNDIDDPSALSVGSTLRLPGSSSGEVPQPTFGEVMGDLGSRPRPTRATAGNFPLTWPVQGTVTSRFGQRWGRAHDGIDIGAPTGTAVRAAARGEVLFSAPHGSYGNLVVLKHDSGLVTVYAHHDQNLVRKGQAVDAGQTIAKVGATGRATGPHLHFEVRRGTKPVNPLKFLPP